MKNSLEQDHLEKVSRDVMPRWWTKTFPKALRTDQAWAATNPAYHWEAQYKNAANSHSNCSKLAPSQKSYQNKTTTHKWPHSETLQIQTPSRLFPTLTRPCTIVLGRIKSFKPLLWINRANCLRKLFKNILIVSPTWWKRMILIWGEFPVGNPLIPLMRDSWERRLMSLWAVSLITSSSSASNRLPRPAPGSTSSRPSRPRAGKASASKV